ncbi:MAG TPA: hypothetical protein VML55_19700 [Planctomycetaceae bacterium]|nr:hypothetical protein [Planctomycetaceae bacterium]
MQNILPVVLILVFVAINVAVFVAVFYFLQRWMAKRVPAPVRRRGQLNALICGVGVVAVLGLLTVGIWAIFKQPVASSAIIAFGIFWLFIFTAFFVSWLHAKATSGPVLLDCGPHPTKRLFFFQAAFFLLVFGGGGLVRFIDKSDTWGIAVTVFGVTMAIYCIVMASGRLQIRENGIWQYWGLLKWNRLRSYKWEGDSLLVEARTRFPFFGKGAFAVPREHKTSMEEFLTKHCTAQGDA